MSGLKFKFEGKTFTAARGAYVKLPFGTLLRVASVADDGTATVQEVANRKANGIPATDITDASEDTMPDTPPQDLATLASEWSSLGEVVEKSQQGQKAIESAIASALLAKRAGQKRTDPVPTFRLGGKRYRAQKQGDDKPPVLVPVAECVDI